MQELSDITLSMIVIIVLVVFAVTSLILSRKVFIFRISSIVIGLIGFVVVIFTLLLWIFFSVGGIYDIIGLKDVTVIMLVLIVLVGIVSFVIYDRILQSRLGFIAGRAIRGTGRSTK